MTILPTFRHTLKYQTKETLADLDYDLYFIIFRYFMSWRDEDGDDNGRDVFLHNKVWPNQNKSSEEDIIAPYVLCMCEPFVFRLSGDYLPSLLGCSDSLLACCLTCNTHET